MAKRLSLAVLTPLVLGGCLPLPVTIASTALSGVSYLTTGKSSTDHVISAAREEDCALANPVFGEEICKDLPDGEDPYITVASYPGDWDDGRPTWTADPFADRSRSMRLAGDMSQPAAEAPVAGLAGFAGPVPEVTAAGLSLRPETIRRVSQSAAAASGQAFAAGAGGAWPPAVPSRTVDVAPLGPPAGAASDGEGRSRPKSAAAAEGRVQDSGVAVAAETASGQRLPLVETGAPGASGRYVVVGSFRDRGRAEALAADLAGQDVLILAATVKGERWNRVALGPFAVRDARAAKAAIGPVGGREPWIVRLTTPIVLAGR